MTSNYSMNQDYESEDEEEQIYFTAGRDATIVVIDCSASMFKQFKDQEGDEFTTCLYAKCLTVLERLLLNKIISNNKDLVSETVFTRMIIYCNLTVTILVTSRFPLFCTTQTSRRNQREFSKWKVHRLFHKTVPS